MIASKIKVVSLFSGCGGLDYGFLQAGGYEVIWANDILKDACETYKLNFGDHIVHGDITTIDKSIIPEADVLIGGPPCQSFSLVGKRNPNDERSNLVWSYLEVLQQVKPKFFLLENVTGLLSAKDIDGTKVVDNLVKAFENLGYTVKVYKLNAADYGVPQKRVRVFLVGNKDGLTVPEPTKTHSEDGKILPKWIDMEATLSDLSDTTADGKGIYLKKVANLYQKRMRLHTENSFDLHFTPYESAKDKQLIKHIPPGGNYANVPDEISTTRILNFKKTGGRTTTYGRLAKDKPSYTLNTHFNRLNVGCNIHYEKERLISLREGLRIQSFPDNFIVSSKTKRNYYVQIGNAVPPMLGEAWAKIIYSLF
ncbi:MAG: hypothetical protein RLZZ292_3427 [Bacteroidota bacterium]|jgi:DNA (cytosine-5)-methyltransferase 1